MQNYSDNFFSRIFRKKNLLDYSGFIEKFQHKEVFEESAPEYLLGRPKLSVILIAYQHGEYIDKALSSILNQKTKFKYEVIVADDDSTDNTVSVVKKYLSLFPEKVRLFKHREENKIQVLGKNCGIYQISYSIYKARGEYYCLLSGDDWWEDEKKIEKQLSYMEANQDCMVSFHDWCFYFASEKKYDAVKKGCRINSAVFRGNVAHLPKQFMTVLNEDTFLFNCYRKVGSFEYVDGLKPSVARIHGNNIWGESDSNNILQVMHRVNTKLNFLSAIKATKTNVVEISSLPGLIYKAWPESNCFIRSREFFPFVMVGVFLWPIVYLARKIRGALNA